MKAWRKLGDDDEEEIKQERREKTRILFSLLDLGSILLELRD